MAYVVQGAGHQAKRLVLLCVKGLCSNPVEREQKMPAEKTNSNTESVCPKL